jgi:anti-sigma B factor antagonist
MIIVCDKTAECLGGRLLEIVTETHKDIDIYRLKGHLDSSTAQKLEEKVFQAIANGTKNIVFDFLQLEYISSAGIRVILKATKAVERQNRRLVLCSMHDYVKEVFEISGVGSLLSIYDTIDDAIKDF